MRPPQPELAAQSLLRWVMQQQEEQEQPRHPPRRTPELERSDSEPSATHCHQPTRGRARTATEIPRHVRAGGTQPFPTGGSASRPLPVRRWAGMRLPLTGAGHSPAASPASQRPLLCPLSLSLSFWAPGKDGQRWVPPEGLPSLSPLPGSAFGRSLPGQQESLPVLPGSARRWCCFSLCLPPGYRCLKQGLGKSSGFDSPWRDLNSIP